MARAGSIIVGNHTYTAQDAAKTLANLAELWGHHTHDSTIPEGWLAGARGFVAEMASLAGVPLPRLDDVDEAMTAITASMTARSDQFVPGQWEALMAAMWRFFPTMRVLEHERAGHVAHLHASKGLPKRAIDEAEVTWRGVTGDVQTSRVHHGRPWQALCLWSTEAIEALRRAGHPIAPGCAGENITVSGIAPGSFRPGAHVRIGEVRGFLSAYTLPCSKNSRWFTNGDHSAMHHLNGPHSRLYAMVTTPGRIRVGDTVEMYTDR